MDFYLRSIGNIFATIVEERSDAIYVAEAKEEVTAASDAKWRVRRVKSVTSNGVKRTTVSWANGNSGFSNAADDMTNLIYSEY